MDQHAASGTGCRISAFMPFFQPLLVSYFDQRTHHALDPRRACSTETYQAREQRHKVMLNASAYDEKPNTEDTLYPKGGASSSNRGSSYNYGNQTRRSRESQGKALDSESELRQNNSSMMSSFGMEEIDRPILSPSENRDGLSDSNSAPRRMARKPSSSPSVKNYGFDQGPSQYRGGNNNVRRPFNDNYSAQRGSYDDNRRTSRAPYNDRSTPPRDSFGDSTTENTSTWTSGSANRRVEVEKRWEQELEEILHPGDEPLDSKDADIDAEDTAAATVHTNTQPAPKDDFLSYTEYDESASGFMFDDDRDASTRVAERPSGTVTRKTNSLGRRKPIKAMDLIRSQERKEFLDRQEIRDKRAKEREEKQRAFEERKELRALRDEQRRLEIEARQAARKQRENIYSEAAEQDESQKGFVRMKDLERKVKVMAKDDVVLSPEDQKRLDEIQEEIRKLRQSVNENKSEEQFEDEMDARRAMKDRFFDERFNYGESKRAIRKARELTGLPDPSDSTEGDNDLEGKYTMYNGVVYMPDIQDYVEEMQRSAQNRSENYDDSPYKNPPLGYTADLLPGKEPDEQNERKPTYNTTRSGNRPYSASYDRGRPYADERGEGYRKGRNDFTGSSNKEASGQVDDGNTSDSGRASRFSPSNRGRGAPYDPAFQGQRRSQDGSFGKPTYNRNNNSDRSSRPNQGPPARRSPSAFDSPSRNSSRNPGQSRNTEYSGDTRKYVESALEDDDNFLDDLE